MEDEFSNLLNAAIYDEKHYQKVIDRVEIIPLLFESMRANNPNQAKQYMTELYKYIHYDHNNYESPENLLDAAKRRTQYFHGLINSACLEKFSGTVISYTLAWTFLEIIDRLEKPNDALELTLNIIDTYSRYMTDVKQYGDSEFANKIINLIDLNINEDLSTKKIAEMLHMNPDYVGQKFKNESGETITTMCHLRRIELAKNYLLYSSMNITETALVVGYNDVSYFSKNFKKYTGKTPREFRG